MVRRPPLFSKWISKNVRGVDLYVVTIQSLILKVYQLYGVILVRLIPNVYKLSGVILIRLITNVSQMYGVILVSDPAGGRARGPLRSLSGPRSGG